MHGKALGEENVRVTKERLRLGPGRCSSTCPTASTRRSRPSAASELARASGTSASSSGAARTPSCGEEWDAAWAGKPLAPIARAAAEVGGRRQARDARRGRQGHGGVRGRGADDGRRRRGPRPSRRRPSSRAPSATRRDRAGAQRLLRRARARHGRRGERHGRARRDRAAVRLDVPAVLRLHARVDPPQRAHGARRARGCSRTTPSRWARTARPTSRSSTSWRCARSRA